MKKLEQISEKLTQWLGTPTSIIVHTAIFIGIFALRLVGQSVDDILLILTTAVSLEAIYLAIFIQMSVNKNTASIAGVEKDIDNIQEDIEEINEDEDEDEDDLIKAIKDIENRIIKLHKDVAEVKSQKLSTPRGNRTPITSSED